MVQANGVRYPLQSCPLRRETVSAREIVVLTKSMWWSSASSLGGLDRARCARVAPNLEEIMGHTHPTPLTPNIVPAAQQKSAQTTRFFDLTKHRFHDHFAPGIQGRLVLGVLVGRLCD